MVVRRIGFILILMSLTYISPVVSQAAMVEQGVMMGVIDNEGNEVIPPRVLPFDAGETAADVLDRLALENDVLISRDDFEWGKLLRGIGEVFSSDEAETYWALVVNGKLSDEGMEDYQLVHGDHILFLLSDPGWMIPETKVTVSASKLITEPVELTLLAHATAYDALVQAALAAGIPLDVGLDSEYFIMLDNIGDYGLGDTEFWEFKVNDVSQMVGLSGYEVQENDQLSFVVTDWETGEDAGSDGNLESGEELPEQVGKKFDFNEAQAREDVKGTLAALAAYILEKNLAIAYGSEWFVIGLVGAGADVPDAYLESVTSLMNENKGDFESVIELARVIIALALMGEDVTDFAGVNLIEKLSQVAENPEFITTGIYSLIALNSGDYGLDEGLKEGLVDYILSEKSAQGGWDFLGDLSIDITGMALQGLAPYKDRPEVAAAIEEAKQVLSEAQDENGGYYDQYSGGYASETAAQVIIGLTAVGIDPTGDAFTKSEGNLISYLLSFRTDDGLIKHVHADDLANDFTIEQAIRALGAYQELVGDDAQSVDEHDQVSDKGLLFYSFIVLGVLVLVGGVIFVVRRMR